MVKCWPSPSSVISRFGPADRLWFVGLGRWLRSHSVHLAPALRCACTTLHHLVRRRLLPARLGSGDVAVRMTSSTSTPTSPSSSTAAPGPNPPIETVRYGGVNKLPADLLEWPGTEPSTAPSTIVLFIPGNPGLVHYYTSFLSTLHSNLHQTKSTIYALGHLDHSTHAKVRFTSRGVPGLREQIEHKVAFIDQLKKKYPTIGVGNDAKTKLVLIAHSIGSHISCECIKARPTLISSAILLFPTISHMALTPNGRRLWPLFSPLGLAPVGLSTALLSYLPRESLSRVVGRLSGQSDPGSLVTTGLVTSPGAVIAALTMAREEMRDVTDLDVEMLKKYGDRLCWYWARGDDDGWVLPSSVQEIEQVLDQAGFAKERRKKCEEGMQHAFVLTTTHSDSLAIRCAAWVADDIAERKLDRFGQTSSRLGTC